MKQERKIVNLCEIGNQFFVSAFFPLCLRVR